MVRKLVYSILCLAVLVAAMSFTTVYYTPYSIRFENYVGDKPLNLDSVSYKNVFGQSYKVSMFKYYVGNFHFKNKSENDFISKGYFLIDQENKNSLEIKLDSIPTGKYDAISFTLGVDSIDNCSGAQAGALDPVNGMFWAWNTGYIFLKIEGISPASNSTGKRLEFHIGGYKAPNNCIRRINLEHVFYVDGKGGHEIVISANLNHLFDGPNPIDFSKISSVTDFHNAKSVTDNYSSMFTIYDLFTGGK